VFQTPGEPQLIAQGCRSDMFAVFERILPDFRGYFAKEGEGWDFDGPVSFPLEIGQGSFIRNTFSVLNHREILISETASGKTETKQERPRGMQYLEIND